MIVKAIAVQRSSHQLTTITAPRDCPKVGRKYATCIPQLAPSRVAACLLSLYHNGHSVIAVERVSSERDRYVVCVSVYQSVLQMVGAADAS